MEIIQYVLICTASLTQNGYFEVHPCCYIYVTMRHPFLFLSSIPLDEYTKICLNRRLVDEHFGCFRFLDTTNKTANIPMQALCVVLSLALSNHLGVEWLDYMTGI